MNRIEPIVLGLLGFCIAQFVLVIGLGFAMDRPAFGDEIEAGLTLIAGGLLLAMRLVIDPMVPDAGKAFVLALKSVVIVMFFAIGAFTLYGNVVGRIDFL